MTPPFAIDPLFPAATTLPLSESGGVCLSIPNTPGYIRPFAATLAVPSPAEAKKHDTTNTRHRTSQRTQNAVDGGVEPDTIADVTTDS